MNARQTNNRLNAMPAWGWALTLLALTAAAFGETADPDRGLLFYTGFDAGFDAVVAQGDAKAILEKKPEPAPGFRGQAVRCGYNTGNLRYAVQGNLNAPEGTIELWVKPVDWFGGDGQFHVFFRAEDPGWLQLYKYGPWSVLFLLTSRDRKKWTCASAFKAGEMKPGEWYHLTAIWSAREARVFINGREDPPMPLNKQWLIPAALSGTFALGDLQQDKQGRGTTLLDEVYIYNRALSEEEVRWIVANAKTRAPGKDIPRGTEPAIRSFSTDTDIQLRQLQMMARINPRYADAGLSLQAVIHPAKMTPADTNAVKVNLEPADGVYRGACDYSGFRKGKYVSEVAARQPATDAVLGSATNTFEFPGDGSEWRYNRLGLTDTPPPPWTPLETTRNGFRCWGRNYAVTGAGLLEQVASAGADLLARPVMLSATSGGEPVQWRPSGWTKLKENALSATWAGSAQSSLGDLTWRVTGEYDGFLWYEAELHPRTGAAVDKLELRIPIKPTEAAYYYSPSDFSPSPRVPELYGLVAAGTGALFSSDHTLYVHLGNDVRGLQACIASDEPWRDVDRRGMVQVERRPDSVDIVWQFATNNWVLPNPWRARFGLQATPVKSCAGWREWRFSRRAKNTGLPEECRTWGEKGKAHYIYSPNAGFFDGIVPEAVDPAGYRAFVEDAQRKGEKVMPYLLVDNTSPRHSDWRFLLKGYRAGDDAYWVCAYPSKEWIEWYVFKTDRLMRDYALDGLYYDLSNVRPTGQGPGGAAVVPGTGYWRDGVCRKVYPILEYRELYRRLYCAVKTYGAEMKKGTRIIAHAGRLPFMAINGFSDMSFSGEHIQPPYERTAPMELLRIVGQSDSLGVGAYWIPQRPSNDAERLQQSRVLMGRLLLAGIEVWNVWMDPRPAFEVYAAEDKLGGLVQAEFWPYWGKGGQAVAGQTEHVKASVYHGCGNGGSLIVACNLSGQERAADLAINANVMGVKKSAGLQVLLAEKAETAVTEQKARVRLPPYGYALLALAAD